MSVNKVILLGYTGKDPDSLNNQWAKHARLE